jgi:hypothetical protein
MTSIRARVGAARPTRQAYCLGAICLLVALPVLVSCTHSRMPWTGAVVKVSVRNFAIDAPTAVPAGAIHFVVHSAGPTMHEFNIAQTDLGADALPLAADGTVDDTKPHAGFTLVAGLPGIDLGETKTLSATLPPGHYVLYCNMDGHYTAGMSRPFTVTSR